jgi:hypothetical protein
MGVAFFGVLEALATDPGRRDPGKLYIIVIQTL